MEAFRGWATTLALDGIHAYTLRGVTSRDLVDVAWVFQQNAHHWTLAMTGSATEESDVAVEIEGVNYVSAAELAREVGVSRQTIWRWRKEGKIPAGHRFRDRQVMFTIREVEAIRRHANRIEPIASATSKGQLELLNR